MIVERTRMGLARKASKGKWTGGTPPFGYLYDSERRVLVPAEEEAALVGRIFSLYADRRWGSAAISRWLNETCRTTRRRSRWTPKTVLDVLRNPTYVGQLPFRGSVHQAGHDPITDSGLFERAQALLKEQGENYPLRAANSTTYLLTSLMRCGRCGHGFVGTAAHGKAGTTYRYYRCFARRRHGTGRCDQERIPADALEQAIVLEALAPLDDGSIFEEAARRGATLTPRQSASSEPSRSASSSASKHSTATCERSRPADSPRPRAATGSGRSRVNWRRSRRSAASSKRSGIWRRRCPRRRSARTSVDVSPMRLRQESLNRSSSFWPPWSAASSWSHGHRSSRTFSRRVFVRWNLRGGGRESNPPAGARRHTGFEGMSSLQTPGKPLSRAFAFRSRPRACKDL